MSPKRFDEKITNYQSWLALLHLFLDFGNTLYWGSFDYMVCSRCAQRVNTPTDIELEWEYPQRTGKLHFSLD